MNPRGFSLDPLPGQSMKMPSALLTPEGKLCFVFPYGLPEKQVSVKI